MAHTFSLLSGEGGAGIINIFKLVGSTLTPLLMDSGQYQLGIPNIKVSSLVGTVQSQTLALSGEIQITEETLVKAQLNYKVTSATLLSFYGTHDAEAIQDDKALGFRIGVGFY